MKYTLKPHPTQNRLNTYAYCHFIVTGDLVDFVQEDGTIIHTICVPSKPVRCYDRGCCMYTKCTQYAFRCAKHVRLIETNKLEDLI